MSDDPDIASLFNVHNAHFIGELYDLYLNNPGSVDESWQEFFNDVRSSQEDDLKTLQTPNWASASSKVIGAVELSKKNSHSLKTYCCTRAVMSFGSIRSGVRISKPRRAFQRRPKPNLGKTRGKINAD